MSARDLIDPARGQRCVRRHHRPRRHQHDPDRRRPPERVSVVRQTEGNARTLAAKPVLGRGFSSDDERRGLDSGVAIISDSLWRTRFGGSPSALGAAFRLDDRPFKVIGVMPPLICLSLRGAGLGADHPGSGQPVAGVRGLRAHASGRHASLRCARRCPPSPRASAAVSGYLAGLHLRGDDAFRRTSPAIRPATLRALDDDRRVSAADGVHQRRDAAAGALGDPAPRVRGPRRPRRDAKGATCVSCWPRASCSRRSAAAADCCWPSG